MPAGETEPRDGVQRAAVLMVLLGSDVAGKLLKELPPGAVKDIVSEVAKMGSIDAAEAQSVLEEYFMDAVEPDKDYGGLDVAHRLLAKAEISQQLQDEIFAKQSDPVRDLLGPLLEAPPDVLSAVLSKEHSQTAALVLLHLEPSVASRVLGGIPEETRSEVIVRMTDVRQVRGEILQEVVASLDDSLRDSAATTTESAPEDGMERTAAMLQTMARNEVRILLEGVERDDPERAAALRDKVFTFDSLILADDRGIQELLRLVETKTLALGLHGVEETLQDKFLGNLSERAAGMLREEIEFLGTVRPADQQTAQQEITKKALELEGEEKLVFGDPADSAGS